MTQLPENYEQKMIIFYDGECGFCNHWIQWLLERDKKDKFLFSPLQSEFGQTFLKDRNLENKTLDTIYLWQPKRFYLTKSDAIIKIATELGGIYELATLGKILPNFAVNKIYDFIANRRKQLSKNHCFYPNQEQQKKFIN